MELWKDFEAGESYEAKFVKAIDKMEAQIQHNEMSFLYWNDHDKKHALSYLNESCAFDSFLIKIKDLIQKESSQKMENFSN